MPSALPPEFDLDAWLALSSGLPPVVQAGTEVLRQRARPVPARMIASAGLRRLVEIMVEVMRKAPGVGLAAPQIGVPLRVFVAEDPEERLVNVAEETRALRDRKSLPLLVVVNPHLELHGDTLTFFEGCLSVKGYGALVPRRQSATIRGVDAEGRALSMRLSGWPARILQHEHDHLEGTLYVDRMLSRSFACEPELSRLGALPVDEVMRDLDVRRTTAKR